MTKDVENKFINDVVMNFLFGTLTPPLAERIALHEEIIELKENLHKALAGEAQCSSCCADTEDRETKEDFDRIHTLDSMVTPLMKYLRKNYDPHTLLVIDCNSARILRDECGVVHQEDWAEE